MCRICMVICVRATVLLDVSYLYGDLCPCNRATAIPIIIEGHETAFNGFEYQFTSGKPLKDLKPTLNYYGNGSTGCVVFVW
jgi:hypothetical protein